MNTTVAAAVQLLVGLCDPRGVRQDLTSQFILFSCQMQTVRVVVKTERHVTSNTAHSKQSVNVMAEGVPLTRMNSLFL